MFLNIWNNFRGYVVLEITGFSVERFVNLAVHRNIYIWDVRYTKKGVQMKVSVKAFKLLRSCAKKTRCKIKVVEKRGCPFFIFKYRKRKILLWGILFSAITLYFLSSFIWMVEIHGNERVKDDQILALVHPQQLKVGKLKFFVKPKDIETLMLNTFSDISWVSIYIKGTKAMISVKETLEKQPLIDKSVTCNVVAEKDGLISSIITTAGTPLVKEKDVVKKGDLMVKSEINSFENGNVTSTEYVHADSEVKARFYYEIKFDVPFKYDEKYFTGNIKKDYGIKILDKKFDFRLGKNKFSNYDKSISRKQLSLGENYPLPVIFFTDIFREFKTRELHRSLEQAKELAEKVISRRIIRELDVESDVVDKKVDYTVTRTGIMVDALVTTIERIDKKVPVTPPIEYSNFDNNEGKTSGVE